MMDGKAQYRYLEPGEIIQEGDECEVSNSIHDQEKWQPARCIGQRAPERAPAHRVYRRPVTQVPEIDVRP